MPTEWFNKLSFTKANKKSQPERSPYQQYICTHLYQAFVTTWQGYQLSS